MSLLLENVPNRCTGCNQRRNKIYCAMCQQAFCQKCYLSIHLFQFNHNSIILPTWTGNSKPCSEARRKPFYVYCLDCHEVCFLKIFISFSLTFALNVDMLHSLSICHKASRSSYQYKLFSFIFTTRKNRR